MNAEFISEMCELVEEKYQIGLEVIRQHFPPHERSQLMQQLNLWYERLMMELNGMGESAKLERERAYVEKEIMKRLNGGNERADVKQ